MDQDMHSCTISAVLLTQTGEEFLAFSDSTQIAQEEYQSGLPVSIGMKKFNIPIIHSTHASVKASNYPQHK